MILSTNQFMRDYNDSPELRAVSLDSVDGTYTVMTDEEEELDDLHSRVWAYADEYDCSFDAAWCAMTMED